MISFKVDDEEFQTWLTSLEYRVSIMKETLLSFAHMIGMQGRKFVPVDTTRLELSYKAVPIGGSKEFIEVELGYSSLDSPIAPKTYFDYAEYVHTGIDWRTGKALNFQKIGAEAKFLWRAIETSEKEGWRLVETDYLSLFGVND